MIPKVIYQVSIGLNHEIPPVQEVVNTMRTLNPDYGYKLFTHESELDNFVHEHYSGSIVECYDKLNILVAKTDLWRYLYLYVHGGVYLDMDSALVKPLSTMIDDSDEAVVTKESILDLYVQWALVFNKGHPILKRVIELIVDNIQTNRFPNDIHKMTGPTVFTQAVNETDPSTFKEFGRDYDGVFTFSFPGCEYLFRGVKKWTQLQREVPLLKC